MVGCASTIRVDLTDAKIVSKTLRQIGMTGDSDKINKKAEVIQFNITSKKELHHFFNVIERKPIQVFCQAEGAKRTNNLKNIGFGPYYNEVNISKTFGPLSNATIKTLGNNSPFKYSVFAFVNLEAGYTQLHYGVQETSLNLEIEQFDRLSCIIIGATYPPMPAPKSNEFGIDRDHFMKMLGSYKEALR